MPYMKWKARHAEIVRLKAKTPKYRIAFPDLGCSSMASPCTNSFGSTDKREPIKGAKQFPIGHNHKQGFELITPGMMAHLAYLGGKKT